MEKQRANPGPKPRLKRTLPLPGDMIALGKIPGTKIRPESDAGKHLQGQPRKSSLATTAQKRKEIISPPVHPVTTTKQLRTFSPSFNRSKESGSSLKLLDSEYVPPVKLIESQAVDLEDEVLLAHANQDIDRIEGLLCNALKQLKVNRMKPDPMLYLTLIHLAKIEPIFFQSKAVVEFLLALLRKENTGTVTKTKSNSLLCIMACNILFHAFSNESSWPQSFLKVYVEDALGDRSWVDNENNTDFVANIISVFGTQPLPKQAKTEEERLLVEAGIFLEADDSASAVNRYITQKDEQAIMNYIIDIVKEQLNKRQVVDSVSRNLLRFLVTVCGYVDVRLLASQKIETWIQNPKLTRPAQDLLMSVALNCNTHSVSDVDVIGNLIRMRLKQKPLGNHYIQCIKKLLEQHPDNLGTVLKHIVYNELSQQRNPNNMSLLAVIFSSEPEKSAQHLSAVFLELLCNREDFIRPIRALLREIVRTLKYEMNMVEFCRGLMQERCDVSFSDLDQVYKDRMFSSVIDLICLGCFLSISPQIKELSNAHHDNKDFSNLNTFQKQLSIIQRDAIWFFHTKVLPIYRCNEKEFVLGLRHILFLDPAEQYCTKDNWPPESDRQSFLQLVQDIPIMEDGLLRLHLIGLADDLPVNCAATLDIIEKVVLRAAKLKSGNCGLVIERTEVIQMLLSLSAYTHPKDITLPVGYIPPTLAISNLYWKAWWVLLVLVATNPSTIGARVWEEYPTARCMMEMIITGAYSFPPLAVKGFSPDEIQANELQVSRAEKDDIVEFESHLAAATSGAVITESTSLLISQLISLDPCGLPRQPPVNIIEKLKHLNKSLQLNELLCQSRFPDFLLAIIQAQGTSKAMPWLADLVQSSESSLNTLPVQCLCEFLLMKHTLNIKSKQIKPKVASRLQDLLIGNEATSKSSKELVKYFVSRWSSSDMVDRDISVDGLQSILLLQKCSRLSIGSEEQMEIDEMKMEKKTNKMMIIKDDTYGWLHEKLTALPYFEDLLPYLMKSLQKSLRVEVVISRLEAYIAFLIRYSFNQTSEMFHMFVKDLSHLIVKRKTIINKLLGRGDNMSSEMLKVFLHYFQSSLVKSDTSFTNAKQPDELVLVTWDTNSPNANNSMIVFVEAIQAVIFILAKKPENSNLECYKFVMDLLCSENVKFSQNNVFNGFLCDALIKSSNPYLVKKALKLMTLNEILALTSISGLPLESISMVLDALDDYCQVDAKDVQKLVKQNGLTKLCCQWVELNWQLGVVSGKIFYETLEQLYKNNSIMSIDDIASNLSNCKLLLKTKEKVADFVSFFEFNHQNVKECLEQFFIGCSGKNIFYNLKKNLALSSVQKKNERLPEMVLSSLNELMVNEKFLEGFCASNQSALLLKLLVLHFHHSEVFLALLKSLVLSSAQKTKPLKIVFDGLCRKFSLTEDKAKVPQKITKVLGDFIRSGSKATINCVHFVLMEIKRIDDITEVSRDQWVSVGRLISSCFELMFEIFIQVLCAGATNSQARRLCIDILIELMNVVEQKFVGIIVSFLDLLDPEILCLNPLLQRQLIFKYSNGVTTLPSVLKAKSYLISLLTHQAQNSTLEDCFNWILDAASDVKGLNAKQCLDVIGLMIENPRLWYGGESKEAKELSGKLNESGDHLNLALTIPQVYRFIQVILCEANNQLTEGTESEDLELLRQVKIQSRLPLLFNLVGKQTKIFKKAIQLTRQVKRFPPSILMMFLKLVYMHNPLLLPDLSHDFTDVSQLQQQKTVVDKLIHRLILSIAEPDGSSSWEEKFQSVSAIIRRIAYNHPHLYSRQLPLILSLLQGKSRASPATFRITQSFRLFMHVLNLCDLLRPHIFMQNELSQTTMELLIDVFLQLIQSPCLNPDQCAVVVSKLVELVNGYISSGNTDAAKVLSQHEFIFMDLMYSFPSMQSLTAICTFIKTKDNSVGATLCASSAVALDKSQLSSLKTRFVTCHRHQKELLEVIHDLDENSKRRVDILEYFLAELASLTTSQSQEIRNESHLLLLRHCVHKPCQATSLINVYLECLESDDPDIVSSASMHVPQFLLFVDVNCGKLLKRLFDISTKHCSLNDTHLLKTVANLNIDFILKHLKLHVVKYVEMYQSDAATDLLGEYEKLSNKQDFRCESIENLSTKSKNNLETVPNFLCNLCENKSSFAVHEEHILSELHLKSCIPQESAANENDAGREKEMHNCDLCNVICNGSICWKAHLQGLKHKKRKKQYQVIGSDASSAGYVVEKDVLRNQLSTEVNHPANKLAREFMNHPEVLIGLEFIVVAQKAIGTLYFECSLCHVKFDSHSKFSHITGVKHRLNVVKLKSKELGTRIEQTCYKRSALIKELADAALKIERFEGRQKIRFKTEHLFILPEEKEQGELDEDNNENGLQPRKEKNLPSRSSCEKQSLLNDYIPSLMDQEIRPPHFFAPDYRGDNSLLKRDVHLDNVPQGNDRQTLFSSSGIENVQRHSFDYNKNVKHNLNIKSFDDFQTTAPQNRSSLRESCREKVNSPFKRICKKSPTNRNLCSLRETQCISFPDNKLRVRNIFPHDLRRSRSPCGLKSHRSGIFHRSRTRNVVATSLSKLKSSRSLSPLAEYESPYGGFSPPQRDIGDEIKEEMKRIQKQAEEMRRAEHQEGESKEREKREEEEMRNSTKEQEHGNAPPPPPRTLDEETKRLVMQNLTELAKCCVTNEADADLALQISNALTQALLQYRMENMPTSMLQALKSVTNQQFLQQQQPFIGNVQPLTQFMYSNVPGQLPTRFFTCGRNLFSPDLLQYYLQTPSYSQFLVSQNTQNNFQERLHQYIPRQQLGMCNFEPQQYEYFQSLLGGNSF